MGGDTQVHVARALIDELYQDLPAQELAPADDSDWPGLLSLWKRYGSRIRGVVIWDPELEQATIEAATTIAAQCQALPVSPMLARHLEAPVLLDLRQHCFNDNISCLHWLLEHYFDASNKDVAFTWSHMTTGRRSWGAANKDYVTALKLFTFYLDIFDADQRQHYQDVLGRYPPGTPIMGWTDEIIADGLFADMGHFMVPCISVENLTVHASLPSCETPEPLPSPGVALQGNAIYAACHVADGDNLLHSMVYQVEAVLRDPAFGKVPATWILNPGLVDLAPRLHQWYRDRLGRAGQEYAAMMGDGHPSAEQSRGFKAYCRMTREYLDRAGILSLKVMAQSEAVAWNVQPKVLLAGYHGRDRRAADPLGYHMDGATFHIDAVPGDGALDILPDLIERALPGEPLLLNLFCGTAKTPGICGHLVEVQRQLERLAHRAERPLIMTTSSRLREVYQWWGLASKGEA
ncbi:MAG: hypothetical protein WD042_07510 [Phycisphaeraceae bacterium]